MYKRILITKPLVDIKVSSWEISNFIAGIFLAKVCAMKLLTSFHQDTVRSSAAFIFEFGSPVLILMGCIALQLYFSNVKLRQEPDFDQIKELKKTFEIKQAIIHSLFCSMLGFGMYLVGIILLSKYISEVTQYSKVVNGLIPFEYSLAVCMCLIWGNIVKFTTHYKI